MRQKLEIELETTKEDRSGRCNVASFEEKAGTMSPGRELEKMRKLAGPGAGWVGGSRQSEMITVVQAPLGR